VIDPYVHNGLGVRTGRRGLVYGYHTAIVFAIEVRDVQAPSPRRLRERVLVGRVK